MKNFFNQNLSPTALLTLIAIDVHSDKNGLEASQSQIAELIGVERKTVLAALKELRDRNFISITRQEPHKPFLYSVTLSKKRTGSGGANVPSVESKRLRSSGETEDPQFTAFWQLYPRRVAKPAAKKAWQAACRKARPDDILAATRLYAEATAGKDKTYIPHPSTWLNQERFNDDIAETIPRSDPVTGRRAAIFAALAGNGDLTGADDPGDEERGSGDVKPPLRVISARNS